MSFTEKARAERGKRMEKQAEKQKIWKKRQDVFTTARDTAAKILLEGALILEIKELEKLWSNNKNLVQKQRSNQMEPRFKIFKRRCY